MGHDSMTTLKRSSAAGLPTTTSTTTRGRMVAPRGRQVKKTFKNLKLTILCGFVTILVLRGTIDIGNLGSSSGPDLDVVSSFSRACLEDNASNGGFLANGLDPTNLAVNISCEQKCQVSRRTGPDYKNHLPPVAKRRRKLNACGRTEMNRSKFNISRDPSLKQEKASGSAENPDFRENVHSQMDSSREKKPCSSFYKGCSIISDEGIQDPNKFNKTY